MYSPPRCQHCPLFFSSTLRDLHRAAVCSRRGRNGSDRRLIDNRSTQSKRPGGPAENGGRHASNCRNYGLPDWTIRPWPSYEPSVASRSFKKRRHPVESFRSLPESFHASVTREPIRGTRFATPSNAVHPRGARVASSIIRLGGW